jgi:hypothetical protein
MAFGLRVVNPIGELVISDDGYLPVYLGTATLVSTVQPVAVGTAATGTGTAGFSTLTFPYAGKIVPVLALPPGRIGAVYYCEQSGTTWTMKASFTDGTVLTNAALPTVGMYVQVAPTVHVFGLPSSLAGLYGGALYNGSGALVAELARTPLFIRNRILLPAGTASAACGSFTTPGIAGRATDVFISGGPIGASELYRVLYRWSIFEVISGTIYRRWDRRLLHNEGDPGGDGSARLDVLNLWLVECNGLTV